MQRSSSPEEHSGETFQFQASDSFSLWLVLALVGPLIYIMPKICESPNQRKSHVLYEKTKISMETSFLKTSCWLPNTSSTFETLGERNADLLLCVFMKIQLKTSRSFTRDLLRQYELHLHYLKTTTRGLRSSLSSDQTSANTLFTSRWWAQRSKCLGTLYL